MIFFRIVSKMNYCDIRVFWVLKEYVRKIENIKMQLFKNIFVKVIAKIL